MMFWRKKDSGVSLKGEVLGSSKSKRTNNLPVDVEAFPPTVRGCWCAWHFSNSRPHPLTTLPHDELSPIDQINNLMGVVEAFPPTVRGVSLKGEVLGSSNAKRTSNLPVDMEVFPLTVVGQLVTACPVGELLQGEVLGSINAKRTNNLPVDVEAFSPTGEVLCSSNAKRTNNLPVDVEVFPPTQPLLFILARSSSRRSVLLTSVRRGPFCFPSFGYASPLVQFSARKLRSRHFGNDYPVVEGFENCPGVCIFSFVRLCLGGCLGSVSSGMSTSSAMAGGGTSMWWSSEFPLYFPSDLPRSVMIYSVAPAVISRQRSDFGGSVATMGDDSSGFSSLRMLVGGSFSNCQ
ncbi:hypothetical protein Bca4012_076239 [Brassica carinata]